MGWMGPRWETRGGLDGGGGDAEGMRGCRGSRAGEGKGEYVR